MDANEKIQLLNDIYVNYVYVAGAAFVLGSMTTLLALLLLDFMQRNTEKRGDGERRKGEKFR